MAHDFAEVMHDSAAEPSANQGTDANGEECKAHVGALLAGRRETRNIFVVARCLNHFAKCEDEDGEHRAGERRPKRNNKPGERRDESAENEA